MTRIDALRDLLAEASESAPSDRGLLGSVHARARRYQRRRQALLAAVVVVAGLAGFGGVKALADGDRDPHPAGPTIGPTGGPTAAPSPSGSVASCPAGAVPALTALIPESAITVKIYNGSKTVGLSQDVGVDLEHRGFTVNPTSNSDVKPRTAAIAEISYGPKTVGAAQVVRAYFSMIERATDRNMHFDINNTSDVVNVTVGSGFRLISAPTEVHQDIAALGRPSAPPGTCASDAPVSNQPPPLVNYAWPTFPYVPAHHDLVRVDYDEDGIAGLGVTGMALSGSILPDGYGVIFVSAARPTVPGTAVPTTVRGRQATFVQHTPVPLYKDDGTKGSVLYWNDGHQRWVALVFGPTASLADAKDAANQLSATPVSVLSTFVPAKIPAGMRVAVASPGRLVLRSDEAGVPDITVTAEYGPATPNDGYVVGDSTYSVPFDEQGHVDIVTGPGSRPIDLAALAAVLTVVPGDVSALTGGG